MARHGYERRFRRLSTIDCWYRAERHRHLTCAVPHSHDGSKPVRRGALGAIPRDTRRLLPADGSAGATQAELGAHVAPRLMKGTLEAELQRWMN